MGNFKAVSMGTAAQMLGVGRATITRWAQTGRLPIVGKLDGTTGAYLVDRATVERLAAERRAELAARLDRMTRAAS